MRRMTMVGVVLGCLGSIVSTNADSVLTFDPPAAGTIGGGVDQRYGDNMTDTPDVTVSYNRVGPNPETQLTLWSTGYGNLTNVIYPSLNTVDIMITFTAASGHSVTVAGFDMGSYSGTYDIPWTAKNGSDNATLTSGNLHVVDGATHAHVDITGATANVVKLTVQTSTLGFDAPNVAIDNVAFGHDTTPPTATPTFNPDGGTFVGSQTVTISCTTPGAVIHYTADNTTPTLGSPSMVPGGTFLVNHSLTLKAMAFATGYNPSSIKTATYTILTITAKIDQHLLDLIDQYAADPNYYRPTWNMNIDQYKAWIATIAWGEGLNGGYGAHSRWAPDVDVFAHKDYSSFAFSTGIGPFQLDRGGYDGWDNWTTIKKLDPEEAVKTAMNQHYTQFPDAGATLQMFSYTSSSNQSSWNAALPGNVEAKWLDVTGTTWSQYSGDNVSLNWSAIKTALAKNANDASLYPYVQNVQDVHMMTWNIPASAGLHADSGKSVIFTGAYQTWHITARREDGTKRFQYYYTYDPSSNIEVWVLDNTTTPIPLCYIFTRECNKPLDGQGRPQSQFPEHRTNPGDKLTSPALYPQPKMYGLLVGSTDVFSSILPFITIDGQSDAEAMEVALGRFPTIAGVDKELFYAPDTTLAHPVTTIQSAISNLSQKVKPGDTVVFFYSGHGTHLPVPISVSGILITSNETEGKIMSDQLTTWFDNDVWKDVNKLFIFDSCYSGGFAEAEDYYDRKDLGGLTHSAVLAACAQDGQTGTVSPFNPSGFFTSQVLKALAINNGSAAADLNHDGLTFSELKDFVTNEVSLSNAYDGYLKDDPGVVTFQPSILTSATADFGVINTLITKLVATIDLSDFPPGPQGGLIQMTLRRSDGTTDNYTTTLDSQGQFVLDNITPEIYSIWIKPSHWLTRRFDGVTINGETDLGTIHLTNGDCDGDNEITSTDMSIVLTAMDSTQGDSNYDPQADLNGDNHITEADLSILLTNMDQMGDPQ